MSKSKNIASPFTNTDPKTISAAQPATSSSIRNPADEVKTVGTSIRTSEADWLQQYADEHGATLGSLLAAMLRHSAEALQSGWTPPKKRTRFVSKPFTWADGSEEE